MNKLPSLLVSLGLIVGDVIAGTVVEEGYGEYRFGLNETKANACAIALEEAKRAALRKTFGEVVIQSRDSVCGDSVLSNTGNTCEIYERGFASINTKGFISSYEPYDPEFAVAQGYEVCRVKTKFTITKFNGSSDATFEILDFKLSSGSLVRETDKPQLVIKSNRRAYHYVYYWAPDNDPENYYLLYPNPHDPQNEPSSTLYVPSSNKLVNYTIGPTLPKGKLNSYEFLFLLSSKTRLDPPQIISQKNYQLWLFDLDRSQWTQQKLNYQVVKGESL